MAVDYVVTPVNVICVADCGDTTICIGNFEFYVVVQPGSDPFHLEINGQDYGIVGPSTFHYYYSANNGCAVGNAIITIDGVDTEFVFWSTAHCCEDAAIALFECPTLCVS